jgi:pyruvate-ferredoxin/flavodoxin oxidoreductase
MNRPKVTIDGNEAAAHSAYHVSEVCAIYPITPSSPMGEWADEWAAKGKPNIWGEIPKVVEMQSEAGAAAALHGALQAGALGATFTAAQGLLLMIPTMFKVAGELTSTVIHVTARTVATHALSIFGDHGDVMACRQTGFAMLCSNSIQEAMDLALIAHAATLESRVPFLHYFDGFRTSHEVGKVEQLTKSDFAAMVPEELVRKHRERSMTPDRPVLRGTAQNPDVFFQARETVNPFYDACPGIVQQVMDRFGALTGRPYRLFDYYGAPDADRIIILMGSGAEVAQEAIDYLNERGEKIGMIKVRLYRPFSVESFLAAIPATAKSIAVLDRTKEPGAVGDPLYTDVVSAISESFASGKTPFAAFPKIVGGRYGLSSKDFTPAMVKAVFDELAKPNPKNHFTVGINDDVTHTSIDFDPNFSTEDPRTVRGLFYGLGSDGTVGANKNSIKILAEETDNYAQGYFVYDSKKAGTYTISHVRFGPKPIHSSYLISSASFIACHQFTFLERLDMLKAAAQGATFLLNSPYGPDEVWGHLPSTVQKQLIEKKMRLYVVDGYTVAAAAGMGTRINTIMQTCFFAISGVLPRDEAIAAIKKAIEKTYGKRGEAVVKSNFAAVDAALGHLHEVTLPSQVSSTFDIRPAMPKEAPEFVRAVLGQIYAGNGDDLPVSAFPPDGTFPTATAQWERRNIAFQIPVWDEALCIQCGKCVLVCPHASIRAKLFDGKLETPAAFKAVPAKWREFKEMKYSLQVAPEDCTGCGLCVEVCPVKSKTEAKHKALNMEDQIPLREQECKNWEFFLSLPDVDRAALNLTQVKDAQLLRPLFEFSGACAGCGETPYVKLMTQLFGDRAIIGNATGCSSIYGGNLPTTPYAMDANGRGPTWSNSLFEDAAEFAMGMRIAVDTQTAFAKQLLGTMASEIGAELVTALLEADQKTEKGIAEQRERVRLLKEKLAAIDTTNSKDLQAVADMLVKKSVWGVGGDGWAYDIGYGGLDHVLASGENVNLLVLDTEVYSNTGGQASKATPTGAVAKFAFGGKVQPKKDLALIAMSYGNCYVARVAFGANDMQTVKAFLEAEAFDGPSIIIAYSHCIAQGITPGKLPGRELIHGLDQQKAAVQSGYWTLLRYNPDLAAQGKNPLVLESKAPSLPLQDYIYNETRYSMLKRSQPEVAAKLLHLAEENVKRRWKQYEYLAAQPGEGTKSAAAEEPVAASKEEKK